ncbi:MAG TPA: hypothetical protein DEF45_16775 [Rhodopirellula sp.]|nr:hypothetical protein [Rhodopirellula sp.]
MGSNQRLFADPTDDAAVWAAKVPRFRFFNWEVVRGVFAGTRVIKRDTEVRYFRSRCGKAMLETVVRSLCVVANPA